jgi:hypothetical protein
MNDNEILDSIAFCGLVCALDSCFENCDGCRSGSDCGEEECIHRICCIEKRLKGCWECEEFPCSQGFFSADEKSRGQFVGCVKYIQKFGLQKLVDRIRENQGRGIKYGLGGDYADKSEAEVLSLLQYDTEG